MNWNQTHSDYLAVTAEVFGSLKAQTEATAGLIASAIRAGGKVLLCGNGGSAADAQHFAGELVNRFLKERRPFAAISLTTDTSVITSIGNDYSYAEIFSKQVEAIGRKGDVLIAISTSGNAANACLAVETAKRMGIVTVGMLGGDGGKLAYLVDHQLRVSCTKRVPRIQEGHAFIIHALCEIIEEQLI